MRGRGRNFYLHVGEYLDINKTNDGSQNNENKSCLFILINLSILDEISKHLHPTLGVWHILPSELSSHYENKSNEEIGEKELERSLDEHSHGLFIYFHGNSFDRSTEHRCELYNVLSAMDFHVLTIDYRGIFKIFH